MTSDQPKPADEWTADTVFKLLMSQEDDHLAHEVVAAAHNAALAEVMASRERWKEWCHNAQEQLAAEREKRQEDARLHERTIDAFKNQLAAALKKQ